MFKIKKGDLIKVLAGKNKGKTGKVSKVMPDDHKIVVDGINLSYKNLRPKKENEKGQRIQFPVPLQVSKVMLVCPRCNEASRVGFKILEDGTKNRFCKKCGA